MRDIDKYAKNYIDDVFEINVQVKYRRALVINTIEKYKARKILEIGCGIDPIFQYLNISETDYIRIVEPEKSFCENARDLIYKHKCQDKVQVINGYFEDIYKVVKDDYDFVLCSGLLHEVESPSVLLDSIFKICGNDTIVHINVPNAYSLHRILALEMGLIDDLHRLSEKNKLFQHRTVYDMETLLQELRKCGFMKVECGTYFCKPFTHQQMQELIDIGIITENMLDAFDRLVNYMPKYGSEIYVNVKKM